MGARAPRRMRGMRLFGAALVAGAMVLALPATVALAGQGKGQARTAAEHPSTGDWHPAHGAHHPGQGNSHPPNGDHHPPDGEPHPPDGEPHPPDGEPEGNFTCRASVLRLEGAGLLEGQTIEPVVANADNDPCEDDQAGLDSLEVGPLTASLLQARTDVEEDQARSTARVAEVELDLEGGTILRIEAATSQAGVTCQDGEPTFSGSSSVVRVAIEEPGQDPQEIDITGEPNQEVDLGLILIILNQQIEEEDSLTQRAVFASTPIGDLIVAESIADVNDNPCA